MDYAQPELKEDNRDCRPYMTGPKASSGLKEYGEKIDWEQELDRILAAVPA